jgi:AcrR family transcriptional regulator
MHRRAQNIKTEIRQEQIARAALVLIARHGLNHLSIGALAREVGVVPSAVYRHYRGKDEVLESVLDLISRSLLGNVAAVCQATPDALERLHFLLMRHVQLVRHHAGIPRVLFSEEIFAGNSARRHRAYKTLQGYLDEIAGIVGKGQQQGQIRADISPDTAAVMFLGLIQPAIILWLMSKGAFDVARHGERAWCLYCAMLQRGEKQAGSWAAPEHKTKQGNSRPGKREKMKSACSNEPTHFS